MPDGVMLDLASGELLTNPLREHPDWTERQIAQYFEKLGKGDLWADHVLGTLRGATAAAVINGRPVPLPVERIRATGPIYRLPDIPCQLRVTTAEDATYEVHVLASRGDGGLDLKYRATDTTEDVRQHDHFIGKYAFARRPTLAEFEIKREGETYTFSEHDRAPSKMQVSERGLTISDSAERFTFVRDDKLNRYHMHVKIRKNPERPAALETPVPSPRPVWPVRRQPAG